MSGNHVRAVDFSGYLVRSILNKVSELLFYSFHIKGEKKKKPECTARDEVSGIKGR